jgi:hypothetical protein
MQCINISADYKLDPNASIGIHFPTVIYDGQISPMVLLRRRSSNKEPFPPGSEVWVKIDGDYYQGIVKSVPVSSKLPNYQITFQDSPKSMEVPMTKLTAPDKPMFPLVEANLDKTSKESIPKMPNWIKENTLSSTDLG